MKTSGSAISRRLSAGVAPRALAAGSASAGDLRSGINRGARNLTAAIAALGLMVIAPTSFSHAQAPNMGTASDFAVLGGSTVTNTGPSVLNGNLGVSPGSAITGFPPGIVTLPGAIHAADAVAGQAQVDLTTAYNNLVGRPTTVNLTGQDLGGLTLTPGVYTFNSSAQLTGGLTLNAQGNPNAVFIFKIGSTLTTASSSTVKVIGGGQGTNVFWQVGSSATLGTTTSFVGDILALTSITLNTGANIACGSALARNGAVTLDTNNIAIGSLAPCTSPLLPVLPTVVPPAVIPVVAAIDAAFVSAPGSVPQAMLNLSTLSPSDLAIALTQLSGEAGTAVAPAGIQAMNSFLSLLTNPFADNRGVLPESPVAPRPKVIYKAPVSKAPAEPAPDPRRWDAWASAFGGQNNTTGDTVVGSHDRSARTFGYAIGLDYRVTPYTVTGFALAGGSTNFGLSNGIGGGRSDMFQSSFYSLTRYNAAYVSTAIAYGWHHVSTNRLLTMAGTDQLTANFSANNVAGRTEGGYRFASPEVLGLPGFGFTPYAALQVQAFRTPSYSEMAASSSSAFALAYNASTTTTTRTELGAWFDRTTALDGGAILALRARTAWAHDHWSGSNITAAFQSLPGSSFAVISAAPVRDSLLSSAVAEISFRNGISLAGKFDGELAKRSRTYTGTARLRYTF